MSSVHAAAPMVGGSPGVLPPAIKLREYQLSAIGLLRTAIRNLLAAKKPPRVLLVSPTGSGKGTIASSMISSACTRGKRVLFLVNRRELVKDLSRRLTKLGVEHGVIMGSHPTRPWLTVQVASIDTLHRRTSLPPADLIFVDEAHFSLSSIWLKTVERYPKVPLIGMTATPCRADGRGLGELFHDLVECPGISELTEMGHLVPARTFAPAMPDLSGVKTQAGDYNQKQLAAVVDRRKLIGDIVDHWLRLAKGIPTLCNAVNVEHSKHIVELFTSGGVRARHVDADTPDDERDRCWRELADGTVEVVCQVGIASYGFDLPPVACSILARPTKSLALYLQQVGRILRPYYGKSEALVLDHASCTLEHGLYDDPRDWTLDGAKKKPKNIDRAALSIRMCQKCWLAMRSTESQCPQCGAVVEKQASEIKVAEGELKEITRAQPYAPKKLANDPIHAYYQTVAGDYGKNHQWAWKMKDLWPQYPWVQRKYPVPAEVIEDYHAWRASFGVSA